MASTPTWTAVGRLFTLLLVAAAALIGCPQECPPDDREPPTELIELDPPNRWPFYMGVSPIANDQVSTDDAAFFANDNLGNVVLITGGVNWLHEIDPVAFREEATFLRNLVTQLEYYGVWSYLQVDFWGGPQRDEIRGLPPEMQHNPTFSNPDVCDAMIEWTKALRSRAGLNFLGFGVEVNYYKYKNGEIRPEYYDWLDCYHRAMEILVPYFGPTTWMGPTFMLEDVLGLLGQSPRDLEQILEYDQDAGHLYGFSSFPNIQVPGLIEPPFEDPADVPDDYWAAVHPYVFGEQVFIETGWSADCRYGSSPVEQAEWAHKVATMSQRATIFRNEVNAVFWYFMSDPVQGQLLPYFDHAGLMTRAGDRRPAFDVWNLLDAREP